MAPSRVRIPPSPLAAVAVGLLLAACAGCGAAETAPTIVVETTPSATEVQETAAPAEDPALEPVELEVPGWGTCLVTAVRWQTNASERAGFCVDENVDPSSGRYSVSCVAFDGSDLSSPPDGASLLNLDEPPTPQDVAVWETEGCEIAYPAAREWIEAQIAKL
jgi:hypothetical protein